MVLCIFCHCEAVCVNCFYFYLQQLGQLERPTGMYPFSNIHMLGAHISSGYYNTPWVVRQGEGLLGSSPFDPQMSLFGGVGSAPYWPLPQFVVALGHQLSRPKT